MEIIEEIIIEGRIDKELDAKILKMETDLTTTDF
jgi:hypothetical protein